MYENFLTSYLLNDMMTTRDDKLLYKHVQVRCPMPDARYPTVWCFLTPEMEHLVRRAAQVPITLDLVLCHDRRDLIKLGLRELDVSRRKVFQGTRRLAVEIDKREHRMQYWSQGTHDEPGRGIMWGPRAATHAMLS